nr:hypothetical protein [Oscillatoria sp. PCC 10802]
MAPSLALPAQLPLFESVTVSPKFDSDPMAIRGISGGEVAAEKIAGRKETPTGPCAGFADEEPDHILTLTAFFNYLSLQVESPEDTTLIVRGPGGSWCSDDQMNRGQNPGIAGQWRAGTYKIWIGSYKAKTYHPYSLEITEVR